MINTERIEGNNNSNKYCMSVWLVTIKANDNE